MGTPTRSPRRIRERGPGNARVDPWCVSGKRCCPSRDREHHGSRIKCAEVPIGARCGCEVGVILAPDSVRALVLMGLAATPFGLLERWVVSLWMMLAIVSTVGVKASCDHPHNRRYRTPGVPRLLGAIIGL